MRKSQEGSVREKHFTTGLVNCPPSPFGPDRVNGTMNTCRITVVANVFRLIDLVDEMGQHL